MNQTITLTVNGAAKTLTVDAERLLLDVLREDLQLTGTKYGCGEGLCGSCTVLVDGKNVRSCQEKAVDMDGKSITTIEGLAHGDALHPVQEAFLAEGAMQCGYCTPGMVLTTVALLKQHPAAHAGTGAQLHERQPVPMQRVCQDPPRHSPCRGTT